MESNYAKLVSTLRECFMLDQPDLDFGIYRVMNVRRDEIVAFLEKELVPQVKDILRESGSSDRSVLEKELAEALENAKKLGVQDPESLDGVKEVRKRLAGSSDLTALENETFSHLANFFRRYYDSGDFISTRRYKKDVYAVPYEGEEVKLHWANNDQYYTKTSEYFKNYRFRLPNGKAVSFVLVEATVEKDNNKALDGKDRMFRLYVPAEDPAEGKPKSSCEAVGDEFRIHFTYEPAEKGAKQDSLIASAFDAVKGSVPQEFSGALAPAPTDKDRSRTVLQKHLNDYVKRNTFDYFIHKDLKGFLSRELDFYAKNEILRVDEVDSRSPESFLSVLSVLKAVKLVGGKVVEFLSQLEEFQKKLWLKKKFVVETGYCLTLDRVGKEFYPDVAANAPQTEEWVSLFAIDRLPGFSRPLSLEFLESNQFLPVDTKHFPEEWKLRLVSSIDGLDASLDGLLVNSENFQALNFLMERYRGSVDHVYIDPPYNTSASEIIYKNNYRHSSWLSLMHDRLTRGRDVLADDGVMCTTIDDTEFKELYMLLESVFGPGSTAGVVSIRINPSGRPTDAGFALCHEYAIFSRKGEESRIRKMPRTEEQMSRYDEEDERGPYEWRNFRREGSNSDRADGRRQWYPVYADLASGRIRVPEMSWDEPSELWVPKDGPAPGETEVWPVNDDGAEKNWRWSEENVRRSYDQFFCKRVKERPQIYYKYRPNMEGITPLTFWGDAKYSATEHGTKVLKDLFGISPFSYPKSVYAVEDCLRISGPKGSRSFVMDFFAGSGTTGHAAINLNRMDKENGKRKYALVEMGEYFDSVTKPRVLKAAYASRWENGKPVSSDGMSHGLKYVRLESYEDALNNLSVRRSETRQSVLFSEGNGEFREKYVLSYLFSSEASGTLSAEKFSEPFRLEMLVTKNDETAPTKVDLVETFNYLLGLAVDRSVSGSGIRAVSGTLPDGRKAIAAWRNVSETGDAALAEFLYGTFRMTEYDVVYVNGDNGIESSRRDGDSWRSALIEDEFSKRMFQQ